MITIEKDKLHITITDTEPEQRVQWLIKAIAAAMRWHALNAECDLYITDGESQYVLAQLLEELVTIE